MEYKKGFRYDNEYSLYEKLVKTHLLYKQIDLQELAIKVLIIFVMKGINQTTYEFLLQNKIVSNKQMISNIKTILKEKDLIVKIRNNNWEVVSPLDVVIKEELKINITCIKK